MNPLRLSVNLGSQEDLVNSVISYHPTDQAIEFVDNLASAALNGGEAHALQGPYGVGKSSLAAFAINQISCPNRSFSPRRCPELFREGNDPVSRVVEAGGLVPISVVGASESLASRVADGLKKFSKNMFSHPGIAALNTCATLDPEDVTHEQVLRLVADTAQCVLGLGKVGILLVIDEFGRHLDHIVATASDADLHLLQGLAELTGRTDSPLSLVIVQHFGLEYYSSKFFGARRAEWEKVRGRFRETILNNTEIDTAHIIGKALKSFDKNDDKDFRSPEPDTVGPKLLRDAGFVAAAYKCRPLHPMTVAILSRLARILGQQDRTVVGWLTTDLRTGFESIKSKVGSGWIYPHALFEHFFGDALLVPSNPALALRFAAIHSAHERMGDEIKAKARELFQTIAILNFVAGRGLAANKPTALACLPPGFQFEDCISELTDRSLIVYRRYRDEYAIWEGSDYDITRNIDQEVSALTLDIAAEMNRRASRRVLAHGHLIRTGNRRSAQVQWHRPKDGAPQGVGNPRILVWIGDTRPSKVHSCDVTGVARIHTLEPHLKEAAAIRKLLDEDTALRNDSVAEKELRLRLDFHEARITALCDELLESDLRWQVADQTYPGLQKALSAAMDSAYPKAFPLHNELVNKDKASGQVSAALRKLIDHLHAHVDKETLGIEKFPAERIIYESLLKRSGLHVQANGEWGLRLGEKDLPEDIGHSIDEIRKLYVESTHKGHPTIEEIVTHLGSPPFGIARIPATMLCIIIVLADRDSHEIYEDRQYLPRWGPQTLLRILKTPARFSIAAAAKSPVSRKFMQSYRFSLTGTDGAGTCDTPVAVVRELLIRHSRLSLYARQTNTVSEQAQAFRRALTVAKSPGDMLFRTIPRALGYQSLPSQGSDAQNFLSSVRQVQSKLERADTALLERLESVVLETIDCKDLKAARASCVDLATRVVCRSHMYHGHDVFLAQLLKDSISDDRVWLAGIVNHGLGIAVPIGSWSDSHASQAEFLLRRNLIGLERTGQLISDLRLQRNGDPFAVFWPNPGNREHNEDEIASVVQKISSIIEEVPMSTRMAVVANLARKVEGRA